jgi:hypothetical protein
MGVLVAVVRFADSTPTSAELVAALGRHIDEFVSYEEDGLICPILKDAGSLFAIEYPQELIWEFRTGHLNGSYFWYASLVVLETLGGVQVDFDGKDMPAMSAPAWAYKPWQRAKKEYRWRKWHKPSWLTLDEARRLGVE